MKNIGYYWNSTTCSLVHLLTINMFWERSFSRLSAMQMVHSC